MRARREWASENRSSDDGERAQFEAALQIVETLRATGMRRIWPADACAICCWGASRRTTTWRPARRRMWCWRCFRGPLPWARTLEWCWWRAWQTAEDARLRDRGCDLPLGWGVFRWAASGCGALHEERRGGCAAAGFHDQRAAAGSAKLAPRKQDPSSPFRTSRCERSSRGCCARR